MRPYGYDFIILCPIKARAQVTKIPINVNMVYSVVFCSDTTDTILPTTKAVKAILAKS